MSGSCSLLYRRLGPLPLVYMRSPHWQYKAQSSANMTVQTTTMIVAFATATVAGHRRRGHKNQCLRQLECWLTIFLVLLAVALAVGYYAYCVYGKTKRNDKETEPLMPVATATPMT